MFNASKIQIRLNAAPEAVWNALTHNDVLTAWFGEHAAVDLDARTYDFWGKYTPYAPDRAAGVHPITELMVGKSLAFDWHVAGDDTRASFTLVPDGDGTILLLRHGPVEGGATVEGFNNIEDFWFLVLENLRRHFDGKPSDARVDYTANMRGNVRHETDIDAPPSRVFDVLTKPELMNRWIATEAKVDPVVGGDYNFGWMWEGQDVAASKIIDIVPGERISSGVEFDPMAGGPTVLSWELRESGGKTRITFTHSGFADDADNSGIYVGWRTFLSYVQSLSEYGDAWLPPIKVLNPGSVAYPKVMYEGQDRLLDELKAS